MKKPVRVLHIITGMGGGGAESFIMNMYRHMDRDQIRFDFLLRSNENMYDEELRSYGSRVIQTASFPKHLVQNRRQVRCFLKDNQYEIIHVHANALIYMTALREAAKSHVPCRIMHSHSTSMRYPWMLPYHLLQKANLRHLATDYIACSEDAGRWMFPSSFQVIRNGIDLERFAFDEKQRKKCRTELGLNKTQLVLGHVGRFLPVKNHSFLLNVFHHVLSQEPDAMLLLVGDGPQEQVIRQEVMELGIADHVQFLGLRKDVESILNAMDVFVFPSLYEGLGIAVIEAQANGLPVICSEGVPNEAIVAENVKRLPLDHGEAGWADAIRTIGRARCDSIDLLRNAGFSIEEEAAKLQDFYLTKADQIRNNLE